MDGIRNANRRAKVLCGHCKSKNPSPPLHGRRGRSEAMFNQGRAGISMEEKTWKLFSSCRCLKRDL